MKKIIINGTSELCTENSSIADIIATKELKTEHIVIEHNLEIIKRDHWKSVVLRDGDRVEIVHFVGGG